MGPGLEASIVTRTEASRVPELPATWHEYSPESAGDTWFSLSRVPWTWARWVRVGRRLQEAAI